MCVCVRERERERERSGGANIKNATDPPISIISYDREKQNGDIHTSASITHEPVARKEGRHIKQPGIHLIL